MQAAQKSLYRVRMKRVMGIQVHDSGNLLDADTAYRCLEIHDVYVKDTFLRRGTMERRRERKKYLELSPLGSVLNLDMIA